VPALKHLLLRLRISRQNQYTFNAKAISALIGHRCLLGRCTDQPRGDCQGEPELIVKRKRERLTGIFSQTDRITEYPGCQRTPTRIKVIEINAEHRRIAEIIGKENHGAIAEKQVLAAINAVSGIVTVHSDIGGGLAGAEVPAHIHLLPANAGLKLSLLSRPLPKVDLLPPGRTEVKL